MKEKNLVYCRMRPKEGCRIQTRSKDGVCASCKGYLEQLAEEIALIEELGIVAEPESIESVEN